MPQTIRAPASAADRFRALQSLTLSFSQAVTRERVRGIVLEQAATLAGAAEASVALVQGRGATLAAMDATTESASIPVAGPHPAAEATRTGVGVFDAREATLPLVARNRTMGALTLRFPQARTFDDEERAFLQALAHQCALALERAELHEAEQNARAESEAEAERFRSLVQELDAIFWEADPVSFDFSFVSQRAEAVLGYPVDRWREPGFWSSILHPEDRSWAVGFCVECTRDGEDHAFEYRAVAADGRTVWLRDVVYVVRGVDDKPAKLRGVMVDITRDRQDVPADGRRAARILRRSPRVRL